MMMMMMKNPMTLMTCSLLFSSLAVLAHQGSVGPILCCATYCASEGFPKRMVKSYMFTDDTCSKGGVIFTMKRGKELCADPSERWVKDIIQARQAN